MTDSTADSIHSHAHIFISTNSLHYKVAFSSKQLTANDIAHAQIYIYANVCS